MTEGSRTPLKEYTKKATKSNTKTKKSGTSIVSLMIWLPIWSNLKVVLFGLAKIMTVMFNLIVWLKVLYL